MPAFFVLLCVLMLADSARAEEQLDDHEIEAELASEDSPKLDEDEEASFLEFSQKEQQQAFKGGVGINIGPVMPWSEVGASILWPESNWIAQLSLGAGSFRISDNYKERNYLVKVESQGAYVAARTFPLGFGPIYIEPMFGLLRWNGNIRPRGFDTTDDEIAASLSSRFDSFGASLGANLGLMWIFRNGVFIDYNLIGISWSHLFQESYTTNTGEARRNIRKQLQGPLTMSNLHLRLGWSVDI